MSKIMWLVLTTLACNGTTDVEVGLPDQLRLRVEPSAAELTANDTLRLRLIAFNPLRVPVVYEVGCGDRGLSFQVSNAVGPLEGEGAPGCFLQETRSSFVRIAPGDSVVELEHWVPKRYGGDINNLVPRPSGPYAVAAIIEVRGTLRAISSPKAFELRAP